MIMRSISARDWAELRTGRRIESCRISLVSLRTSRVAATRAALREAAVVATGDCAELDNERKGGDERRNQENSQREELDCFGHH